MFRAKAFHLKVTSASRIVSVYHSSTYKYYGVGVQYKYYLYLYLYYYVQVQYYLYNTTCS
jgi:hypothetical protein